jgi:hypothetical protein
MLRSRALGIIVCGTGYQSHPTAEHTWALIPAAAGAMGVAARDVGRYLALRSCQLAFAFGGRSCWLAGWAFVEKFAQPVGCCA